MRKEERSEQANGKYTLLGIDDEKLLCIHFSGRERLHEIEGDAGMNELAGYKSGKLYGIRTEFWSSRNLESTEHYAQICTDCMRPIKLKRRRFSFVEKCDDLEDDEELVGQNSL